MLFPVSVVSVQPTGCKANKHLWHKRNKNRECQSRNGNTEKKKSVAARKQKNEDSAEGKKQPMKTAADVIKRIEWDELMPRESFVIGYLDRFEGLVEDNFTKFSNWGNLVDAEYEALAIPQHRIEYFKYKGTKVWDKKSELDLVFGSSGDSGGKTIEEIMNEVDDK